MKRMHDLARLSLVAIALSAVAGPASARDAFPDARSPQQRSRAPTRVRWPAEGLRHRKRHAGRNDLFLGAPVSQDAVELATLAPPSRASTAEQSYGDADYARHRFEGTIAREKREAVGATARSPGVRSVCDPRHATSTTYVCGGAAQPGYQTGYGLTPSYLSAPQGLAVPNDEQSRLLSPLTGLAWVVNSLRYDPHN